MVLFWLTSLLPRSRWRNRPVNLSWLQVWYQAYNRAIFGRALGPCQIVIADLEHCGEYLEQVIKVSSRITCMDEAKATLLHEMVHQWQDEHGFKIDHGETFKGWSHIIYGYTLLEI